MFTLDNGQLFDYLVTHTVNRWWPFEHPGSAIMLHHRLELKAVSDLTWRLDLEAALGSSVGLQTDDLPLLVVEVMSSFWPAS